MTEDHLCLFGGPLMLPRDEPRHKSVSPHGTPDESLYWPLCPLDFGEDTPSILERPREQEGTHSVELWDRSFRLEFRLIIIVVRRPRFTYDWRSGVVKSVVQKILWLRVSPLHWTGSRCHLSLFSALNSDPDTLLRPRTLETRTSGVEGREICQGQVVRS